MNLIYCYKPWKREETEGEIDKNIGITESEYELEDKKSIEEDEQKRRGGNSRKKSMIENMDMSEIKKALLANVMIDCRK